MRGSVCCTVLRPINDFDLECFPGRSLRSKWVSHQLYSNTGCLRQNWKLKMQNYIFSKTGAVKCIHSRHWTYSFWKNRNFNYLFGLTDRTQWTAVKWRAQLSGVLLSRWQTGSFCHLPKSTRAWCRLQGHAGRDRSQDVSIMSFAYQAWHLLDGQDWPCLATIALFISHARGVGRLLKVLKNMNIIYQNESTYIEDEAAFLWSKLQIK